MGSLAGSLKEEYIQKYGVQKWHQHLKKINKLWDHIEKRLNQRRLCYRKTKIYQDGLPVCGRERDIVREIAGNGSKNHQLLLKLIEKGATLVGTEDPALLIKEYKMIKEAAMKKKEHAGGQKHSFMAERDMFIAQRIEETLKDGETGILFMGMLHKINDKLPRDIVVEYL